MKVSALISIHNRSRLFAMGSATLARQDFDPKQWELIVIDDMSTEDISKVLDPYLGKLNIVHIRMDHTRHPIFRELNPNWTPGMQKRWWHTPALSYNLGIRAARGEVLWITQPEVLQHKTNLPNGYADARDGRFAFVNIYHDDTGHVRDQIACGKFDGVDVSDLAFRHFSSRLRQESPAKYWFSAFIKTSSAMAIEGIREVYLRGAAAEDDDFRERLELAGVRSELVYNAVAVHLYHGDETEFHHRRDHEHWQAGLDHNRAWLYRWRSSPTKSPVAQEQAGIWGDPGCIVSREDFRI